MSLYSQDWNRKIGCAPGNEAKKREKRVCCQDQQRFLQTVKHTAEEASVCKDVTLICPSEGKHTGTCQMCWCFSLFLWEEILIICWAHDGEQGFLRPSNQTTLDTCDGRLYTELAQHLCSWLRDYFYVTLSLFVSYLALVKTFRRTNVTRVSSNNVQRCLTYNLCKWWCLHFLKPLCWIN